MLTLCPSPEDSDVDAADLIAVDEACPDLDHWIAQASALGRGPESMVVFGTGDDSERGAVPWGTEGTEVLATLSDLLDRRRLLQESDDFLEGLRVSNDRLDQERRRFAKLVVDQADALRGANVELTREVEELRRLQSLARFFAAPGPEESFADRLAEVTARVVGATGVAIAQRHGSDWLLWGRWRISRKNANGILPDETRRRLPAGRRPSTRKGTEGWWIPVAAPDGARVGLAIVIREGESPGEGLSPGFLDTVRANLAEGLQARLRAEAVQSRQSQSERIVQTLRGGLLRIDREGRVVFANPACEAILGRRPADLEGASIDALFPRDGQLRDQLAAASRGEPIADEHETSILIPGGRRVSVSVRVSALPEGGDFEGVLVLLSDLSRRKEVEAEMRRADRLSALGRLSAGVAHEIRNPLAGIRTTAEILQGRVSEDPDLCQFVDVILEEATRLDRIVGSLLQFAKPSEPRLSPLDVGRLLSRAARLAAGRAAERGITIDPEIAGTLPCPLADRDQILQVLLNLMLNAVEATPEGGSVRATARPGGNGERTLEIEIRNGGEGVPQHLRERIFDPFFTTKPGGTGLGLSISQNILRQHGGALRIETPTEGGTRAIAILPLPRDGSDPPQAGGAPWRTS